VARLVGRIRAAAQSYPSLLDASLATALLVAAVIGLTGDVGDTEPRHADATGYVIAVAGIVPYYFRRRAPLAVLLAATVPVLALIERGYTPGALGAGIFILVYTVAAWCTWQRTLVAAGAVTVVIAIILATRPQHLPPAALVTNVVLFAGAFVFGRWARARRAHLGWMRERAALLAERAALLERDRERGAQQAVAEERVRIAQELHDVVAHSIGVIAVQSGAGLKVIDSNPAVAKQALAAISETSRQTLGEIRQILGALRADGTGEHGPTSGLAALDGLVAEMSTVGVPVRVHLEGRRNGLPLGVDLAGYRIVQEALTNVLKHAGTVPADVVVRYEPSAVSVEVTNDGPPGATVPFDSSAAPEASVVGHGLVGMRERVAAWGGVLRAGPRPDGGYRVAARIPYGPT
jgi:signal transduction histidine kinase